MSAWLQSYVPWYVWLFLSMAGIGGGTAALIVFVPAAAPFLVGLWNRTPLWLKAVFVGLGGGLLAYVAGKRNERLRIEEAQRVKDASARHVATEVTHEIDALPPSEVDKRLEDSGGFWPEEPAGGKPRRRG